MRALVFEPGHGVAVRPIDAPLPGPGEARVAVTLAGVCNTDLEILRGYMGADEGPRVLGHELVGRVERCDNPAWIGRRVVGEINVGCGSCEACDRGSANHCATRTVMGIRGRQGCFAQSVVLPIANLHRVPDDVPDEAAVFVEPLAAALQVLEQVEIPARTDVAVIGDGKLGLLVAMVLADHGADVTVVGRHTRKLAIAEAVGCRTCAPEAARARGFDRVVEATGGPEGFALALRLLRPRGTLVLKSTYHGASQLELAPVVIDEITVVGSRCGPFARALALLQQGRIDPRPLLDARYDLADGAEALAHAARDGVLKVVIAPH